MTAQILPFPSRGLAVHAKIRKVVKIVRLGDPLHVKLDHEGGARDHRPGLPAHPSHPRSAEERTRVRVGKPPLPLPEFQFGTRRLHKNAGNIIRYKLTIPCNAIRSCAVTATVLPFLRMQDMPNRILELRRAAGLSQEELGFRVGVSKMQISGMERGKRELSLSMMRRLADELGVYPADLLCTEDNPMRLANEERQLVAKFRSADPDQRRNIAAVTEALVPFRHQDRDAA